MKGREMDAPWAVAGEALEGARGAAGQVALTEPRAGRPVGAARRGTVAGREEEVFEGGEEEEVSAEREEAGRWEDAAVRPAVVAVREAELPRGPAAGLALPGAREQRERLYEVLRAGNYVDTACAYAGLRRGEVWTCIRAGVRLLAEGRGGEPDAVFAGEVRKALADAEVRGLALVAKAGEEDWKAAAWLLERRHPERWGRGGEGGTTVNVGVQAVTATTREAGEIEREIRAVVEKARTRAAAGGTAVLVEPAQREERERLEAQQAPAGTARRAEAEARVKRTAAAARAAAARAAAARAVARPAAVRAPVPGATLEQADPEAGRDRLGSLLDRYLPGSSGPEAGPEWEEP